MGDVRLYQGDCLDVLRTLDAASVDSIVTDPPYAQTNESYESDIACRPELWAECYRVARPGAALLSFAGSPTYHRIASAIEAGGWQVRQMWGWVYRDGMITSAYPKEGFDRLAPAMDPICFATKGKHVLLLEREGEAEWDRTSSRQPGSRCGLSDRAGGHGAAVAKGRWPRTLVSDGVSPFEYFALSRSGRKNYEVIHPNQKPLDLTLWLVGKLPGRVILDPFMGSATTGAACIALGREFIGIERDPDYFAIAARRIDAERAKTPLFQPAEA